jgi:hypothetical protein
MTQPVRLTIVDDGFMSPFGLVGNGRELSPVVFVGYRVVVMCAHGRQRVCNFAQKIMPHAVAWVDSDGMLTLQNKSRRVVYELFPAVWDDDLDCSPIYLGVMRNDSHL